MVHDAVVEIFTSQMGVSGGCEHFEYATFDGEQRNVKGSSTEIVYKNSRLGSILIETIGEGGGGGFIQDPQNIKTGNCTSVLGRSALGIVEIYGQGKYGRSNGREQRTSGHRDDGVGNLKSC